MSDGKVVIDTELDESGAKKGFNKLEQSAKSTGKAMAKGVGIVAGAIGTVSGMATKAYSSYEQLKGGVETLFKGSASNLINYANNAYATSGLSANKYMETVTSFSASLISGLKGDTEKAVQYSDMAMQDMSDNANTFGTNISEIQYAYKGFAKQNYVMLDNLKLGFGGSAGEMARLVNESGVLGDSIEVTAETVKNVPFDKIIEAIHKTQQELGITGKTAQESATTIEGSFNSVKATWENLLVGIADDSQDFNVLIDNFTKSLSTFGKNIIPVFEKSILGVGKLIETTLPAVVSNIPKIIADIIPKLSESVLGLIDSLASSITQTIPQLTTNILPAVIGAIGTFIMQLGAIIMQYTPILLKQGYDMLNSLVTGFVEGVPTMLPKFLAFVQGIGDNISQSAPVFIQKGFELLSKLVEGIVTAIPILIEKVPTIISTFANVINDNFPTILMKGVQLIGQLIAGIIQAIPTLIANVPKIIKAIVDVWSAFNWLNLGKNAIKFLKDGVISMAGAVKNAGTHILNSIKEALLNLPGALANIGKTAIHNLGWAITGLTNFVKTAALKIASGIESVFLKLPGKMLEIGKNLIKGLWNGISDMGGWIAKKIQGFGKGVVDSLKSFFGIHSPARKHMPAIGKYMAQGLVKNGWEKYDPIKQIRNSLDVGMRGLSLFGQGQTTNTTTMNNTYNISGVQTPDDVTRQMDLYNQYGLAGAY